MVFPNNINITNNKETSSLHVIQANENNQGVYDCYVGSQDKFVASQGTLKVLSN